MISDELKDVAQQALLNAYYTDLRRLMNAYVAAAEGFDSDFGARLAAVHARPDDSGAGEFQPNLYGDWLPTNDLLGSDYRPSCGYATLMEALTEDDRAERIWLQGRLIFIKRGGEWMAEP